MCNKHEYVQAGRIFWYQKLSGFICFVFGLVVQAGCVCMQLQSQDGDQKDIAFGEMQYWNHWLSSDEDLAFYSLF